MNKTIKESLFLLPVLLMGITASAQTQQGYVKTKGRMVNGQLVPGQGLKGTTVSVKGRTAVLVKADNGMFSFPVSSAQFQLDSVRKKGYQLVDMDACPRTYNYSGNPIYIVMETPEQQLQDKLTAERKIRRNLQKQLQEREDEIESLKERQQISDEEYRQAMQKLYADMKSNEQLISDMATRYSELDYDQLDEFYRQVSYYIENGELVKADSVLQTRGNLSEQVKEQLQKGQAIKNEDEKLQKAKEVYESDKEELARRCYSYYETFSAQHLNDTAAYYLELRASLDTTNVKWQNDAGEYLLEYLADYDKALGYFNMSLRQIEAKNGGEPKDAFFSHYKISAIYFSQGDYAKAMEQCEISAELLKSFTDENNALSAMTHQNLGLINSRLNNYEEAMEHMGKALAINEFNKDTLKLADAYHIMGTLYFELGKYEDAKTYLSTALAFREKLWGDNHPSVANSYNNLANVVYNLGDYDKALEYIQKALDIKKAVLCENHPDIATSYSNLGLVYNGLGEYQKTLECFDKALKIRKTVFGENHPIIAECYNNYGVLYDNLDSLDKALEYFNMSLKIRKSVLDENHPDIGVSYANIGQILFELEENDQALEYYMDAVRIFKPSIGERHPFIAICYNNIAEIYKQKEEFGQALEYAEKALAIQKESTGEEHPTSIQYKEQVDEIKAKMAEQGNK